MTQIDAPTHLSKVSGLLEAISTEPRLQILMEIGKAEACVCHLEASLGYRQAYISQHLMALREAGLLSTRRDGKYIYYRLEKPEILEMVKLAARVAGLDESDIAAKGSDPHVPCECPRCNPDKE